jgi:hypothetical protein
MAGVRPPLDRDPIGYSVADLQRLLPLGRTAAYNLAHEIGVRVGGRIIVPRDALDHLLRGERRSRSGDQ